MDASRSVCYRWPPKTLSLRAVWMMAVAVALLAHRARALLRALRALNGLPHWLLVHDLRRARWTILRLMRREARVRCHHVRTVLRMSWRETVVYRCS